MRGTRDGRTDWMEICMGADSFGFFPASAKKRQRECSPSIDEKMHAHISPAGRCPSVPHIVSKRSISFLITRTAPSLRSFLGKKGVATRLGRQTRKTMT
jgi:hypothetical protein